MKKVLTPSRLTLDAIALMGAMIKSARIQRGMTAAELGQRVGVSRAVIHRIEEGETGTSIGAVFEAATVLGIQLFDVPSEQLRPMLDQRLAYNALLPRRAFQTSQAQPDNDF